MDEHARAPADWESPPEACFTEIAQHLRSQPHFGSEGITEKLLAQTTSGLVAFCHVQFGAEGRAKRAVTKLPWRFFSDFSAEGPLCAILLAMFQHKTAHAWRRFEFKVASRTELMVGMVRKIDRQLKEAGHLKRPVCYISSALPAAEAAEVAQILQAKGATVVASPDKATHCIEPDPPGTTRNETGDVDFLRQVERKEVAGKLSARVHWYYYPDSYDEWIPVEDIQGDLGVEPVPTKSRWVVHKRWVDDLELFNEFMCERDYEVELVAADGLASSAALRHKQQRVAPVDAERRSRRERRPSRLAEEEGSGRHKRRKAGDDPAQDESWDLEPAPAATSMETDEPAEPGKMMLQKVEKNAAVVNPHGMVIRDISNSVPQAATVGQDGNGDSENMDGVPRLPPEAAWFDKTKLHEKERIALPDFFNGQYPSKNSHTYRQYRDFMFDVYWKQPSKYLHLSTCRESLSGDVGAVAEVHRNMQQWGLINYPPNLDAAERRRCCDNQEHPDTKLQHLVQFDKVPPPSIGNPSALAAAWKSPNLANEMFDNSSTGNAEARGSGSSWTVEETLTLMKALEDNKDDWDAVAARLPNRSKEECVAHFVRMAIEDPFLEDQVEPELRAAASGQIPFIDSGNPLLGQLQFFCNAVHPAVAGAAAGASLSQLKKLSDESTEVGEGSPNHGISAKKMAIAASHALAAAVTRAKTMADTEERRLQLLVLEAVKLQAQKIELKIKHFKEIEMMMEDEREKVEKLSKKQEVERDRQLKEKARLERTPKPQKPVIHLVSVTAVPNQAQQQQAAAQQAAAQQLAWQRQQQQQQQQQQQRQQAAEQLALEEQKRAANAQSNKPPKPPEYGKWKTAWSDKYTRWYWWHSETMETTWDDPAEAAAEAAAKAAAKAVAAAKAAEEAQAAKAAKAAKAAAAAKAKAAAAKAAETANTAAAAAANAAAPSTSASLPLNASTQQPANAGAEGSSSSGSLSTATTGAPNPSTANIAKGDAAGAVAQSGGGHADK